MGIDFVVTWVDMDDPAWRADFAKYSGLASVDNSRNETSEARFRDYGFLKYWFRGVERFAPWVRRIHFVTCGQKPDWLDASHPKLRLVDHRDYIPAEYLPTFNSSVIECHLHRIPDLAENFVYFNDDCFVIDHLPPGRFYAAEGITCDIATFKPNPSVSQWAKMLDNNLRIINANFDKREVMARDRDKWFDKIYGGRARWNYLLAPWPKFTALRTPHNAQPHTKTTFEQVWAVASEELAAASVHRFRSTENYTQELFRMWQICRGHFEPCNTYADTRMFPLVMRAGEAIRAVREQSYRLVCLNDNVHIRNYGQVMRDLENSFEAILPEKSSFEI
jgi:hypothetical protein